MTKKNNTGILLRLSNYIFKQWFLFLPAIALTLLSNQLALLGPRYSGAAIDAITADTGVNFPVVKENVILMAIQLKLTLPELEEFLEKAGYSLSDDKEEDRLVKQFFSSQYTSIYEYLELRELHGF